MSSVPVSLAVLISGSGSNLQALIDHPDDSFSISVVISDRVGAFGLDRAKRHGIPAHVVAWSSHSSRSTFTEAVCDVADRYGARGLVLAGFMRILAPTAMERFPDAIINVHPALLPSFPGEHAVEQALAYGVTQTGVTVHFVDEQVDHGPIIAQRPVPVHAEDNPDTLHARIQEVEHALLPSVVAAFGRGDLTVDGRYVRRRNTAHVGGIQ